LHDPPAVQLVEQVDVEVAELAAKVVAWLRHASSFVVIRLNAASHSTIPGRAQFTRVGCMPC